MKFYEVVHIKWKLGHLGVNKKVFNWLYDWNEEN